MADGRVVIDVILEDGSVAKGVADVDRSLGGIGNSAEKASLSIGKIASALGLVFVAKKGIDMVRDSLDGAIDRYDTLNQFPRVLQLLGFDAQETDAAIQKLSDGIDGLPTTLDSVASTAQNIAVMTGDLDGAVDTTLALNNAFLASGASTADAERGLQQYVQMLSKGEVDLQSWRTLQETMGVALNKLAEEFGFTGESAQNDLYDALKSGEITFDEFNAKLIEASNAQGGFADMAKEASGGIKTSWTNVKTAVVKGVADIIEAIDKSLGGVGSIEGILDNLKEGIKTVFAEIVKQIPIIINDIKSVYNALEPWMPLIKGIATAVGIFIGAFAGIQTVIGIVNKVRNAIMLMNAALMANPVGLVVAAIITAVALIYVYWEPISEFFVNLWEGIKEVTLQIWENITEGLSNAKENILEAWESLKEFFSNFWEGIVETWSETIETIQELWNGLLEFFTGLWDGIKEIFTSSGEEIGNIVQIALDKVVEIFQTVYDFLNQITGGKFGEMVELIKSALTTAWEIIQHIWDYIKQTFDNVLQFLKGLVTGDFGAMKDAINKQMSSARDLLSNIWNTIKSNIGAKLKEILSDLISKFTEMVSNARNKTGEILTAVKDKFTQVVSAIREKLTEAVSAVGEKIGEMPGKVIEFTSKMMSAGKGLIQGLISGIKNMGKQAIDAITGVVDGVVSKAKSLLKINSPSRLFMQYGEWTSEGLAIGIENMKGQAEKASEKLGLGVEEAFEPSLEISGVGALDELKGLSANSILRVNPNNKGMGKTTSTTENKYNNVNFDGLFNGANFHVRDEQDISRLAKELNDYIKRQARKGGVVM